MDDLRLNAIPTLDPKRSTYSAIRRSAGGLSYYIP
jgi:hypothetical protein